jgi:hypothetical protein
MDGDLDRRGFGSGVFEPEGLRRAATGRLEVLDDRGKIERGRWRRDGRQSARGDCRAESPKDWQRW